MRRFVAQVHGRTRPLLTIAALVAIALVETAGKRWP